jgi:hypothetical protein
VDRQWSNKLECYVAQARRVVMAYGLAGAHREELKDKQLLALRTELRRYRLNGSGINKIVRSRCATLYSIKKHGNSVCMTEYLIAARAAIILWTNLAVMPAEIVFDVVEAELERRGVEL